MLATPPKLPARSLAAIAAMCRDHLEAVVAIESSSDPDSTTFPSTTGQVRLARHLGEFFSRLGVAVTHDADANVIATLAGRGWCAELAPLVLMVHLDTVRGTRPLPHLYLCQSWDGRDVPYPRNPRLHVNLANYPDVLPYLGHDLLHGDGVAPFGLDDKLGMAYLMTLVRLLVEEPDIPHRPLFLIARPDEELGSSKTLAQLGDWLAARRVSQGYTLDGHLPFEINVDNFYAMSGWIRFPSRPCSAESEQVLDIRLHGVNTHPATAKSEGNRGAVRLAAEVMGELAGQRVRAWGFTTDPDRDCDGLLRVAVAGAAERAAVERALAAVFGPHQCRGAFFSIAAGRDPQGELAADELLAFVRSFLASSAEEPILAEDSTDFQGYTHPARVRPRPEGLLLEFRIRDFAKDKLAARCAHLTAFAAGRPMAIEHQYDNVGPKLTERSALLARAHAAAQGSGQQVHCLPVRGGTGVDALVERGVCVANLGTGYFAPESEKEFTSLQLMAQHTAWLVALVQQ